MLGVDWKQLFEMMGPALQQQLGQLPPEARQALRDSVAYITQHGNSIHIDLRFNEENPQAEKARDTLAQGLMSATPQVVKMLGCRAFVKILKEEEERHDE
jgi:hypothetical protein